MNPYLALPVVDDDRRLVDSPWGYSFGKRLPWLQINLLTAFVAATVVGGAAMVVNMALATLAGAGIPLTARVAAGPGSVVLHRADHGH